jgi:hypothetical protein
MLLDPLCSFTFEMENEAHLLIQRDTDSLSRRQASQSSSEKLVLESPRAPSAVKA